MASCFGGFNYNSCSGINIYNSTSDLSPISIQCFGCNYFSTPFYADTFPNIAGFNFTPYQIDNSGWVFNTGSVWITNGVYTHTIVSTTNEIYLQTQFDVQPYSSRSVSFGLNLTNGVNYDVRLGGTNILNATGSTGWTNSTVTYNNTNGYVLPVLFYIGAWATNATWGQSTFNLGANKSVYKL